MCSKACRDLYILHFFRSAALFRTIRHALNLVESYGKLAIRLRLGDSSQYGHS